MSAYWCYTCGSTRENHHKLDCFLHPSKSRRVDEIKIVQDERSLKEIALVQADKIKSLQAGLKEAKSLIEEMFLLTHAMDHGKTTEDRVNEVQEWAKQWLEKCK
jgi:hypothetical protein